MIRPMIIATCVVCVGTILAQILGLGLLWYRGQLTTDTWLDVRAALSGQFSPDEARGDDAETSQPSNAEVVQQRALRVLHLNSRQDEIGILKAMLAEKAAELAADRDRFEIGKQEFEEELNRIQDELIAEATEQTRGVLSKMPTANAVTSLMRLNPEESVLLLKGMQEKEIAKILQEFMRGDEEQVRRGQEIFEAISRGEPENSLISQTADQLTPPAPVPTN